MNEQDVLKVHESLSALRRKFHKLEAQVFDLMENFYVSLKWTQLDLDKELGLQDALERMTEDEQAEEL